MLNNISVLLSLIPIKRISADIFLSLLNTCFCLGLSGLGHLGSGKLFIFLFKVSSSISFKSISCFSLFTTFEGEVIQFFIICITPTNKVQK
jgi:hypothetical protein